MKTVLSLREISFAYGACGRLFAGLSMHVAEGEFVSVVGASGSGKSTLFKLIAGLLEPASGDIALYGDRAARRLGSVGYMPQRDLLLPWRTVMDNCLLPIELAPRGRAKDGAAEVRRLLARFGLEGKERAYPAELSGGMRQRVALLRTVMTGRPLLLLDEPFGALDAMTKRELHRWLLGLWGGLDKSVLFITHDLEEALLLSDRVYLMPAAGSGDGLRELRPGLPRPRDASFKYEPGFVKLRRELELLLDEQTTTVP
ncbi:putative hydroxymethylpyrimidine transport system ATP-binding protein [Paenibacillus sp. UNC496MF]|uniref:ABC transporter ATP-binding protein n=1 Tax=Paenibacillus sp. UNC496MF TaxID=1502753 RepID=UPI0008DF2B3F|nr:ATP-binding cassette domain-containing protein [Paenibacillus sp. UNC496MF]SFJ22732.1 putative hydroxymethylpyrimidine transport system ATP-binding protein [Paenibacillus sp. UNC496MF]